MKDFEYAVSMRGTLESKWEEVAQRVIPRYSQTFSPYNSREEGAKKTEEMYDGTAPLSLARFTDVMSYLLTPADQTWHRLGAAEPELQKDREVQLYFESLTRLLFDHRYRIKTGFARQSQECYRQIGAFGTACLIPEWSDTDDEDEGLRYIPSPLGETYIRRNPEGLVNGFYRCFQLNAWQAAQKKSWEGKLPEKITKALENRPEEKFWFLHAVEPRLNVDRERADYKGRPWKSCYIAVEGKTFLQEDGYRVFPMAVADFAATPPRESYAEGPCVEMLPIIKMINHLSRIMIRQGQKAVDPTYIAHGEEGAMGAFSLRAGAVNFGYVNAEGKAMVQALQTGNFQVAIEIFSRWAAMIERSLFADLFQIIFGQRPQMTATEVTELNHEKSLVLAPVGDAIQGIFLGTIIGREIDLLHSRGRLPPMPPALIEAGGRYQILYQSPITRLQKASEVAAAERQVQAVAALATTTQKPELLDIFDFDTMDRESSLIRGMPPRWLLAEDAVLEIRAGRDQAAQQQAMVAAAPGAAALGKVAVLAGQGGARGPKA